MRRTIIAVIFCALTVTYITSEAKMGGPFFITTGEYKCGDNGLNAGQWWTEPISDPNKKDVWYLCGGNVPSTAEKATGGVATDRCVAVNVDTCEVIPLSNKMSVARQSVTPVCLTPGQCFFFGGNTFSENASTKSIDEFTKGEMKETDFEIPEPRLCYAAAVLEKNILVTGGYGVKGSDGKGPVYDTAYLLNAFTGRTSGKDSIKMTAKRGAHSITKLPDGRVLLIGGNGDDPSGAEIFNPKTRGFTAIKSKMKYGRKDHRAILAGGKVYIIGGSMGTSLPLSVEVYDIRTETFSELKLKDSQTGKEKVAELSDGREDIAAVYVEELGLIVSVGGERKGKRGEPESDAIDVVDLKNGMIYSGKLKTPRDEPSLIVKSVDVSKGVVKLLALTGQRRDGGREISLPAEEITISIY